MKLTQLLPSAGPPTQGTILFAVRVEEIFSFGGSLVRQQGGEEQFQF